MYNIIYDDASVTLIRRDKNFSLCEGSRAVQWSLPSPKVECIVARLTDC